MKPAFTWEKDHAEVGKRIGGFIYIHDCCAGIHLTAREEIKALRLARRKKFTPTVFKINAKTGKVFSLIHCPHFDKEDEPTIRASLNVKTGKITRYKAPYWIYHHKWMMVPELYGGFDTDKSMARSNKWVPKCKDFSRIGRQDAWARFLKKHGIE